MRYGSIVVVMCLLMTGIVFFASCFHERSQEFSDPRGEGYASAGSCAGCHRQITGSYAHNVHYTTSTTVDIHLLEKLAASTRGQFYFLDSSRVEIEREGRAVRQSVFEHGARTFSGTFDIAFGSGEKAQTYAYWSAGTLYQLPLTYFSSMGMWANSPGFSPRHPRYDRVIISRCFECHASYVKRDLVQSGPLSVSERLDSSSIVYGIDCQRCHGPAAAHVQFHQENPTVKTARYITSIKSLSRQQQMDVCAACHSGNDQSMQRSLFEFRPGDTLSHFYFPDFGGDSHGEPDVHGKQVQLLQSSRCYRMSNMTCMTCHNAHGGRPGVGVCMSCHAAPKHTGVDMAGASCIDCHMPVQTSKLIHFNNGAELKDIPYLIRTHKIAIPDGPEVRRP